MLTDLAAERLADRKAAEILAERRTAAKARSWRFVRLAVRLAILAALLRLFWWIGYESGLAAHCFP